MSKKVAAISMVKDECDIIELFIKINSRTVDHIFVVDHASKDGTGAILMRMKESGYPLTLFGNSSRDFEQAYVLSSLAQHVASTNQYDFIVPLDADEFIYCEGGRFADLLAAQIPAGGCGQMRMVSYVPIGLDYYNTRAPLHDLFRRRGTEPEQFYKVAIPNELAKRSTLSEGSHLLGLQGNIVPATTLTAVLQHLPVRSADQITAKALLGSHRMSIKVKRAENEAFHWDAMAEYIRKSGFKLTQSEMLDIAFQYMAKPGQAISDRTLDEAAPRVGRPDDGIEMLELAKINLIRKFDHFIADLCAELGPARGIIYK